MSDSFDAYELIAYLRGRWKFVPLACVAAAIAALAGSVLLPKKYSATASILIAPPATSDPLSAIFPSAVYDAVLGVIIGPLTIAVHDRRLEQERVDW